MMHIFSMKGKTKEKGIEEIPDAPVLYLTLCQNAGLPPQPLVTIGDKVLQYQLIAKINGSISANLHAPVSGTVKDIGIYPTADGTLVETIVVENDYLYQKTNILPADLEKLTPKDILQLIEDAGIVGEGGAQFPTHIKYKVEGTKINSFIINGAECEPYLTSDYALMKHETKKLFETALLINKVVKAKEIIIAIEKRYKDLVPVFSTYLKEPQYNQFKVSVLPDQYPQGGELQLIKSVTGITLAKGSYPASVGILVSNVGTVNAIYSALVEGKPVIDRVVTVSGEKSTTYGNFRVKIGTPVSHIMEQLKIEHNKSQQLVLGGPMMGKNVATLSAPVTKGSSGLLILEKKAIHQNNCIYCGYCVDVCPMHLMPMQFVKYFKKEKFDKLIEYNITDCIECSACEYICPASVPLISSIKSGKSVLIKPFLNA